MLYCITGERERREGELYHFIRRINKELNFAVLIREGWKGTALSRYLLQKSLLELEL